MTIVDNESTPPQALSQRRPTGSQHRTSVLPGFDTVFSERARRLFQFTSVKLQRDGYRGYWATRYSCGLMLAAAVLMSVLVGVIVYHVKPHDTAIGRSVEKNDGGVSARLITKECPEGKL